MSEAVRRWHLPEQFTGITAYMFYVHENRDRIQAENPTANFSRVSELLEEDWDALAYDSRQRYVDMEKASEAHRLREKARLGSVSGSAGSTTTVSTITAATTITDDDGNSQVTVSSHPSVPQPNRIFKIRGASCGRNLTLRDGQVVLDWSNGHDSTLWACVESRGWLGFRNVVSGKLLGYDISDKLTCAAKNQQEWESFTVRPAPDGGYILMMTHWGSLRPIGSVAEHDTVRLTKTGDGVDAGIVWEFFESHESVES